MLKRKKRNDIVSFKLEGGMKMKIERVEIAANKMMLRKPFKIALGVITEVSNLTIKVITDTGDLGSVRQHLNP